MLIIMFHHFNSFKLFVWVYEKAMYLCNNLSITLSMAALELCHTFRFIFNHYPHNECIMICLTCSLPYTLLAYSVDLFQYIWIHILFVYDKSREKNLVFLAKKNKIDKIILLRQPREIQNLIFTRAIHFVPSD